MKYEVLIVEDDAVTAGLVREYLATADFGVHWARNAPSAKAALSQHNFKAAIVDLGLPGEDGLSLIRSIRQHNEIGILIMSGRAELLDRVLGLEIGADDYMVKPVELRELLARIKAIIRRTDVVPTRFDRVSFADWTLDSGRRQLLAPDGREVDLTAAEFDLLAAFLTRPMQVLSRDRLLDLTRGNASGPFDRTIDGLVMRLRRKLDPEDGKPGLLKTVHRQGYMLTVPVKRAS